MPETIRGIVERITYHNPENHYTVVRILPAGSTVSSRRRGALEENLVTAVGYFPALNVGESLRLFGEWVVHPEYGRQFRADSHELILPTTVQGIERYLGSGMIRGVGPVTASRLVAAFGERTLEIIEHHPERLTEVEGIGPVRAEVISRSLAEHKDIREIMMFLQSHGVTPGYAARIHRHYGRQTVAVIRENPYRLAEEVFGIGFRTADRIAHSLGIQPTSPYRVRAGIRHLLAEGSTEGHVYLPREALVERAASVLEVEPELVEANLDALAADREVVVEHPEPSPWPREADSGAAVYLTHLYRAETVVAERLAGLLAERPLFADPVELQSEMRRLAEAAGLELASEQVEAVTLATVSGVVVITGGPGTGKTTAINCLIRLFEGRGLRTLLAAPTGRAARRLAETTGREARTIHRLLEYGYSPETFTLSFGRDADNPLDADAVIVDEASMVDLPLFQHLLLAVRPGTRLVLVGDVDQLPPVGPGNVLRDVIRSGVVPVVRLTEIFRQARESFIVLNAHRVNRGEMPLLNEKTGDFFFLHREGPEVILEEIVNLCARRLPERAGLDPVADVQVLSPMRRTPIGVDNLNLELQRVLNPPRPGLPELPHGGTVYRLGDKVMQIRNNYEKGVFNGDIGQVVEVDLEEGQLAVAFPDAAGVREVRYDRGDLDELVLSYAVSVHKSQGSEYPAVVMPVSTHHYVMLQRNLLYTGITRARRLVVLVGSPRALAIAVRNTRIDLRWSRLAARLTASVGR